MKRAISRAGALARITGGPPPTGARHLADLPAKRGRGAAFARGRAASPRGWSQAQPGACRVVVKARYVPMRAGSRGASVHLRYLQRDGVTRDGSRGALYSANTDRADGRAVLDRSEGNPRQFRIIVAAEDGAVLSDLRAFTRDLIRQVERDLGTGLDWVAVDHFNTGHPYPHIEAGDGLGEGVVVALADVAHGGIDPGLRQAFGVSVSTGIGRIQMVVATRSLLADRSSCSSASAGVFQASVFRGRELRVAATAAISSALCMLRSVPLGKYWRSSPLVFSLVPRCHGL